MSEVLGNRALNRAALARQHLLERRTASALDEIEHLVGLQAQAPLAPYYGLWSRLEGFQAEELSALLLDRQAARIALMRGTIHLVSARDALQLRPLVQSVFERDLRTNTLHARHLEGLDLGALAEAASGILATTPLSLQELGPQLAERFPGRAPASLAYAARDLLPLVQVPPRGVWGRSGQPRLASARHWLGHPLAERPAIEEVLTRYLAAFGPASVKDAQTWSGLTGLGPVFERLRPRLLSFRNEGGSELFDLPDAPRPSPETPAPARLLAEYDNLLLSHADRSRVMSDIARRHILTRNGIMPSTLLVDGLVAGTWSRESKRKSASVTLQPFRRQPPPVRRELEAEAERLLALSAPEATTREVLWVEGL